MRLFTLLFLFFKSVLCTYNESLALYALKFAQSTYCNHSSLVKWDCKTCESDISLSSIFYVREVQILTGYSRIYDSIIVGYRGSSTALNWWYDFKFSMHLKPYPNLSKSIGVENGFFELYELSKPQVMQSIEDLSNKYKTKKVITTGHSLGSVLTTLLTFDLRRETILEVSHISFGSPRVGNHDFVSTYIQFNKDNSIDMRVVHFNDLIPHMPPYQILLGYEHVPFEILYNDDNSKYWICHSYFENKNCKHFKINFDLKKSFGSHLNYLNITMGSHGC